MTTSAQTTPVLPPILLSPPWHAKNRRQPPTITGLEPPSGTTLAWLPDEREAWAASAPPFVSDEGWDPTIHAIKNGTSRPHSVNLFVTFGPEEEVRTLMRRWTPDFGNAHDMARAFIARFEAEALPMVMAAHPTRRVLWSLPFTDPETAAFMSDAAVRLRAIRKPARAWLERHSEYAARWLIPQALGSDVPATRHTARVTLLHLAKSTPVDLVATAEETYGPDAAAAVRDLLADGGLSQVPRVMPGIPAWAEPQALPEVVLKNDTTALPPEAVRTIVQMLSISKPDAPYPGLAAVQEVCDPASLGALSWTLFKSWQAAASPPSSRWALESIGLLADDTVVRDFAAEVATWKLAQTIAPALAGLDLIANVGSPAALSTLYGISRRAKQRSMRDHAAAKLAECGEALGLTGEQIADRFVQDLGLDADGTLLLDFGPRRFTVSFDEQLEPRVVDESGKVLKTLPKPGVKDDEVLAREAVACFSTLRKEARLLAAEQIQRLEYALWTRRRWSPQEFNELLAGHPLLRQLVRRLVWAVFADAESAAPAIGAFRLAEDSTLADVHDDAYVPPPGAAVGVAHPLDLGADLEAWATVFDDYGILQPFAQLQRPVFTLTEAEHGSPVLERFATGTIDPRRTLVLDRRGWQRGPSTGPDNGWDTMERPLQGNLSMLIHLSPGMKSGHAAESPRQTIDSVWVHRAGRQRWGAPADAPLLGTLDAAFASEILRDLAEAAEG